MNAAPTATSGAADSSAAPATPPKAANLYRDYFDQIFQVPPVICGLRLKPLSIGRYRLMSRFNVKFVAEEETTAGAEDLLMGVLICSQTVADFLAFAAEPDFEQQVIRWGRTAGFYEPAYFSLPLVGNWLRRRHGDALAAADRAYLSGEIARFQAYIAAGSKTPDYWDESPSSRVSAAHWSQNVEVVLLGHLNWSKHDINEEPLGKALFDYFKYMENAGLVRLLGPGEAAELKRPLTAAEELETILAAQKIAEMMAKQNIPVP